MILSSTILPGKAANTPEYRRCRSAGGPTHSLSCGVVIRCDDEFRVLIRTQEGEKMAAQAMTASQFIEDIATRLDGEYSKADVRKVLGAVAEELQGALADGYKVSIAGVGRFEPRAKAGRKKGDLIRNPFDPDAPPKKVLADEPTKVVVKAFPAASLKNGMPGPKTKQGQDLATTLLKK